MQPPQHADRLTDAAAVDALIAGARELREKVEAAHRESLELPADDPAGRRQRALYGLAARHLRHCGEHLGQLRGGPADGDGPGAGADGAAWDGAAGGAAARTGSGEWNLVTDEVAWSPELYDVFGMAPGDDPLPLDELHTWVVPEDKAAVTAMVTACLVDSRPLDGEFRFARRDGAVRSVHITGEPVLDDDGNVRSLWALVRDVTDLAAERRAARESSLRWRRAREGGGGSAPEPGSGAAEAGHGAARELRNAVLPPWRGRLRLPGEGPLRLDIAARRLVRGGGAPGGGDWYDALELPDGSVLLSAGELAGAGLPAAAGLATLLGALRGMASAGTSPGAALAGLNRVLGVRGRSTLCGAVCCRFEPRSRVLTWARAGHPAPVLYRGGTARTLPSPRGVVLGATPVTDCPEQDARLLPGDVVLLYTGGLLRRGDARDPLAERLLPGLSSRMAAARDARECAHALVEEFAAVGFAAERTGADDEPGPGAGEVVAGTAAAEGGAPPGHGGAGHGTVGRGTGRRGAEVFGSVPLPGAFPPDGADGGDAAGLAAGADDGACVLVARVD
ncbi:SpoIIE family protein phosphatase [Streptomyces capparidis]